VRDAETTRRLALRLTLSNLVGGVIVFVFLAVVVPIRVGRRRAGS
jgi:hypothetical protein